MISNHRFVFCLIWVLEVRTVYENIACFLDKLLLCCMGSVDIKVCLYYSKAETNEDCFSVLYR